MNRTPPAFSQQTFQQLPPEAAHFTGFSQEFKAEPQRQNTDILGAIALLLLAVVGNAVTLYVAFWMGVPLSPSDRNAIVGAGLLFGALFVFLAFNVWRRSGREKDLCVLVYAQGLVFKHEGKTEVFAWDEVEVAYQSITKLYVQGVPAGTYHTYTLRLKNGLESKFDDAVQNVTQLGAIIQSEVTKRLLPRALAAFNNDEKVSFGNLEVSRQGLSNGKNLVAWDEVAGVRVADGRVLIKKRDKWLPWSNMEIAQIPNVFVLCSLIDAVLQSRTTKR